MEIRKLFQYQGVHLFAFIALGGVLYATNAAFPDSQRLLWKLSCSEWIWISWIFAGIFQFWISFFWRFELYGGHVSRKMGPFGFQLYRAGYVVFGLLRFIPLVPIALTSPHTLNLPAWFSIPFLVVTIPLSLWGVYCAAVYFGITRASGIDHFDPAWSRHNLEKRGIYKYVPNVMYTVVLLAIYHPGVVWQSAPALIGGGVHHAFVWIHYFCTEKPDMQEIYGGRG